MKSSTKSFASCVLLAAASLTPASAADALDLFNQLEWESSAELSIPSPKTAWGRPTLMGVTGTKTEKFKYDNRATGSDENTRHVTKTDNDLGLGDLLGSGDSKKESTNELSLDNLFEDTKKSTDDSLDLGDLFSDTPKTETKTKEKDGMDLGDLLSDTTSSPSKKPKASALGMSKTKTDMPVSVQSSPETSEVFQFQLGNVSVYWKHGYAPSEARITTTGAFTLEHFLETIDQPGLLEVHKSPGIKSHLQDSIHLQFTQAKLADVLNWISDAYKAPYTLKNRSLKL